MSENLKSYASMSLWFVLGLGASVVVFKPTNVELSVESFGLGTVNAKQTVDVQRVQTPSRVVSRYSIISDLEVI